MNLEKSKKFNFLLELSGNISNISNINNLKNKNNIDNLENKENKMNYLIIIQLKHWLIEKLACYYDSVVIVMMLFCLIIIWGFVILVISVIRERHAIKSILIIFAMVAPLYLGRFMYPFSVEIDLVQKKYAVQQKEIEEKKMAEYEELKQLRIQRWQAEEALIKQSKNK